MVKTDWKSMEAVDGEGKTVLMTPTGTYPAPPDSFPLLDCSPLPGFFKASHVHKASGVPLMRCGTGRKTRFISKEGWVLDSSIAGEPTEEGEVGVTGETQWTQSVDPFVVLTAEQAAVVLHASRWPDRANCLGFAQNVNGETAACLPGSDVVRVHINRKDGMGQDILTLRVPKGIRFEIAEETDGAD